MAEMPAGQEQFAAARPSEDRAKVAIPSTSLTRNQWRLLALLMLSVTINFLDRGSIAAAAPVLASDLLLSPTKLGVLLSAFSWTYPPFLLIAGWAVDRYSVKWLFAIGFFVWSVVTLACGFAHSFNSLIVFRLLLG